MSCPHSLKGGPCSQCAGVQPKRVYVHNHKLYVDGQVVRDVATPTLVTAYPRRRREG